MSQEHVRNVVLAAVLCFIGGVLLTLLGVLLYVKVILRRKRKESQSQIKEEEEGAVGNYGNHLDTTDRRREATRKPPIMMMSENHGGPPWFRPDEAGGHFNKCPECRQASQRWSNGGAIRTMGAEDERERRRARMEEERRRAQLIRNSASPPWTNGHVWTDGRRFESLHCESCLQTYRGPEPGLRSGRIQMEPGPFSGLHHRSTNAGPNQFEADSRRESKNVTFDLDRSRTSEEKARKRKPKGRIDSPRKLKGKLSLSPLRKSRVHPKKKSEHGKEAKTKRTKDGGEKRRTSKDGEKEEKGEQTKKAEDSNPPDSTGSAPAEPQPPVQSGDIPNQQAALLLRQLSAQHLGNRTPNLSLLGSVGSHPTSSGVSVQGGNVLLNATAGAGVQIPIRPMNPAVPHLAFGGPHLASLNVNRQAGIGLATPTSPHVVNPASLLQAAVPVPNPQPGGVEPVPAQNQVLPNSSPLVAPPPGPRPQTGHVTNQKPLETQVPQTKENLQAPQGGGTSAPGSDPAVEPEAHPEPTGSTAGGGAQSAGAPVGVSVDITAAVSGVPGESSVGGDAAAGLLQQELVSEDGGGSAPRRKLRLVLPEKTSGRPPTALERKIR